MRARSPGQWLGPPGQHGVRMAGQAGQRRMRRAEQLAAGLIAMPRFFGQDPVQHVVDGGRQFRPQRAGGDRQFLDVRQDDGRVQVFGKRNGTGEALVQHAAERVDVGPAIHRLTLDLLRCDIVDRAHQLPRGGEPAARDGVLGDAEIGQVDLIRIVEVGTPFDEDVARLHVAVHQAVPVRGVQRPPGLADHQQCLVRRDDAMCPEHRAQVRTRDVVHRDVEQVLARPHVIDGDDVWVVQRRRDPGLFQEAGPEDIVSRQVRGQHLERDRAAQPRMLGLVDDAHPAPAQDGPQPIARPLAADHRQCSHDFSPESMKYPCVARRAHIRWSPPQRLRGNQTLPRREPT